MAHPFDKLFDRFALASAGFERRLRMIRPEQWGWSTPCPDWNVRQLVNHMARGNLNYVDLVRGGSAAEFLRLRDADALGSHPVAAYTHSVQLCATAFAGSGALDRVVDYPLGAITARQALAVRITDTTIHTWDLARAIATDDHLDSDLVTWIDDHLTEIYACLAETPTADKTTHRFFAAPAGQLTCAASRQSRVLHRMGRVDDKRSVSPTGDPTLPCAATTGGVPAR